MVANPRESGGRAGSHWPCGGGGGAPPDPTSRAHSYRQLADFEVLLQTLQLPGGIITIQTTDLVALPANSKEAVMEGGQRAGQCAAALPPQGR